MNPKQFSIALFSDANFLAVNLLENLLSKNCFVNVVTDQVEDWRKKTKHIANKSRFSILKNKRTNNFSFGYSIITAGFLAGDPYDDIKKTFENYNLINSKNLILIPMEKYSFEKTSRLQIPENIGVVYVGDIIGPRIDSGSELFISQVINSVFYKRKMTFAVGEVIYPLSVGEVARTITKWLFSFGPYGKESLLLGPQISGSDFWKVNKNLVPDLKIVFNENIKSRVLPKGFEIKQFDGNLRQLLSETYEWISKMRDASHPKFYKPDFLTKSHTKRYPAFFKPLVLFTIGVLLLPFVLLAFSSGFFYLSYKSFLTGNDNGAQNTLLLGKTFAIIAKEESGALSIIPLVGKVYSESFFVSVTFEKLSNISISAIPVIRAASTLAMNVLGNNVYDPFSLSATIKAGLDSLYREVSLLQADVNTADEKNLYTAKFLESRVNFQQLKNLTLQGQTIAQNLPDILGKGGTKTYLLLFENNMELRPTGGFIGSFGLLTFDSGRITDLTVNDVYSADGQLNGHVEPPAPIKNYLNEANWWLRDSNWDPDFPTSAKRAEWFLDKEMGKEVDGVVAIDLDPIKNILKLSGPVFLSDFNLTIDGNNLYEKTQEEVQQDFFPGSRKKASFLTALSRNLISVLTKLTINQKFDFLRSFYSDLNERHIQLFLHDDQSQEAVANLGWDGAVTKPDCGDGCYPDFVGLVEANVGVNKANYFIERTEAMTVSLSSSGIERKYDVTYKNNANPALGLAGKYRVYIRLLVPDDSNIESVRMYSGDTVQDLTPEITQEKGRKEIGVFTEVLETQTAKIEFSWSNSYQNSVYGKYGIYVRKQAGVGNDPFSLTINGRTIYNSNLAVDYFNRLPIK